MSSARGSYDFGAIEAKWQAYWLEHKTFRTLQPGDAGFDAAKRKFYVLDMFPYPSGVGLHVGHPLGYIATDIYARYLRMRGWNVLHPMGYDAFGLPAEQFAIEHGVPPRETTQKNVDTMRGQMQRLGLGYDWDREIATTDVGYYKWTQWIFLQLYHSWYDPTADAARPIGELVERLEREHLVVNFAGEVVPAERTGMREVLGQPIGTRTWSELTREERRGVLENYRLAYLDEVPVNWCPALGTVLANEEVTNEGRSERGNHPVYRRPLRQWMLRITAYAERLADDLELVDWPESIKLMQRNWIGRSEGAEVEFALDEPRASARAASEEGETIRVYTTRPDTLFGATYMVLAPEHELVGRITTEGQREAVSAYVDSARHKSEMDRTAETKVKTGVFTGAYAINPVNEQRIPIWIADYVLMTYGTGAIMAVPAHDQRDHDFARTFGLSITQVVQPPANVNYDMRDAAYEGEGTNVNSANDEVSLNGLGTAEAKQTITAWLEGNGLGQGKVNYKLRDWLFSRQRYWGEPFPIVHDVRTGEVYPLDASELPVMLPEIEDYTPKGSENPNAPPAPPLGRATEWANVTGYVTEGGSVRLLAPGRQPPEGVKFREFRRELNTMPQWAGSCWYYLRYLDSKNEGRFVDPAVEGYWMRGSSTALGNLDTARAEARGSSSVPHTGGVDLYVGGAEHAVLHLLYARFWHKVLYDLGHVSTPEPFHRLFNQGYIQAYAYQDARGMYVDVHDVEEAGEGKAARFTRNSTGEALTRSLGKMGKSLKNAVSPDEICETYGTDTLRAYEMYMGPLEASKPWSPRDIVGMSRFLQGVWRRFVNEDGSLKVPPPPDTGETPVPHRDEAADEGTRRLLHRTIKRVTADMDGLRFNTAIAALIELNNALKGETIAREIAEPFLKLLSPIAPHLCEELWQRVRGETWKRSIAFEAWPAYDEQLCVETEIEIPVQINGKIRSRIVIAASASTEEMERAAMADEKVKQELASRTVRKVITVPKRLVNIVAN